MNSKHRDCVVVTGAAGFIGARLATHLIADGIHVVVVDKPSHFKERPEIATLFQMHPPQEIVDRQQLPDWLAGQAPEHIACIYHMGACTNTTEYDEAYLERVNTSYTRTLWEWAAQLDIPFFYASSAAVYGDGSSGYDEKVPVEVLKPLNPYGWSKLHFDAWALSNTGQELRPPKWAGFRFFNVYGFGETHKQKMASVLRHAFHQILEKGVVRLFRSHKKGIADGHQKRDFVLVDDVVDVLLHAWRMGMPDGIYNLGTGQARTFLDLVEAAFSTLGREQKIEFIDTPEEIRLRYQYFTEAKMDRLRSAGYTGPFTSIEEGANLYWERLRQMDRSVA